MPLDANTVNSINLLQRGGQYFIPADTGTGYIYRPTAGGETGGRVATLETFFDYFINSVPPPDEAKALDANIEQKLRMHPDVAGAMEKRIVTVASMPWRVEPNPDGPDKELAKQVAAYCSQVLKQMNNFQGAIEILQNAVLIGGQGLEFVWHRDANGVEYPVEYWPVHMSRVLFDRLGNMSLLTRDNAVWGAYISSDPQKQYSKILPRGKFLYHIYRMGQGTWAAPQLEGYIYYGIGIDVALYYVITFDIFCLKYRMKFMERYGMPPLVLYYPENRTMSKQVVSIAASLRGESVTTIPKLMGSGTSDNVNSLYKVDQLLPPSMSVDMFERFNDGYTKPRVDNIILGSGEESQQLDGRGSQGAYNGRRDGGANILFRRDANNVSNSLTRQLMPPVALGRYPNLPPEYWPLFVIAPKEEVDRVQEAEIINSAANLVKVPVEHIYRMLDIPRPKIDPETGQEEETVGGMMMLQQQQMELGNEMEGLQLQQAEQGGMDEQSDKPQKKEKAKDSKKDKKGGNFEATQDLIGKKIS
jgi:phage gp29-like protein